MKRTEAFLMILQLPVDFAMLMLAAASAYVLRFSDWAVSLRPVIFEITMSEFLEQASMVAIGWILIFALTGLYSTDPNRKFSRDLTRVFLACSTGLAAVALVIMFTQQLFDSRFLVAASWGFAILYVIIGRMLMRGFKGLLYRAGVGLRRVVIIGSGDVADAMIQTLSQRRELGFSVVGQFPRFTAQSKKKICAADPEEIIFIDPRANEEETLAAIDFAAEHHLVFKYSADLFATYATNMSVHPLAGVPVVELKRMRIEGWGRVIKRLFDIVVSLALIILLSPLLLFVALAIKLTSRGPVFFSYHRIGLHGKPFYYFKFRSMVKDAHRLRYTKRFRKEVEDTRGWTKDEPIVKYKDDPRITPLGRFLRRWSIDELPELFLVLIGRMSLVGPRPHEAEEVAKYQKHHKRVLSIKPGITGLAQISGRSDLSFDEEVRLDVLYMEKWSLLLDLIIFFKTPFILLKRRRAL